MTDEMVGLLETLQKRIPELVFEKEDLARRLRQMEINFKYLFSIIEELHCALGITEIGTWQERAEQVLQKVRVMTQPQKGDKLGERFSEFLESQGIDVVECKGV